MKTSSYIFGAALAAAALVGGAANAATYQFRVFAHGVRTPPVLVPAAGALAAYESGDFGQVRVGQVAMRDFQFTNTGEAPATGVFPTVDHADLTVSSSTCGVAGAPVTVEGGQSCDIRVTYRPTQFGALTGQLSVQGNFLSAPTSLALTGSAVQEAVGALSPDSTADFGIVPLNTTATRTFTFRNSGNQAATGVYGSVTPVTGMSISANSCGTVAAPITVAGGASCQMTLSYGGSTSSSLNGASVRVSGAFTGAPASVSLSGSIGAFNATGGWSSSKYNVVALTAADMSFGVKTIGVKTSRSFFVRNTGTNGALSVGFQLSGDTSFFKITTVRLRESDFYDSCKSGGVIAGDGLSATPCTATDIAGGQYPSVWVNVEYIPTALGAHSITITPTTSNGTVLPNAITLTGSGQFNPAGAWSSSKYNVVAQALTAADMSFGVRTIGVKTSRSFFMRNTGTNGALSVGFQLSGDTSFFKITTVRPRESDFYDSCKSGGVIAGDGLSATPCTATDIAGGQYPSVWVNVEYIPTAPGVHSVTFTPTTNNGTGLPGAITLTGTGQ